VKPTLRRFRSTIGGLGLALVLLAPAPATQAQDVVRTVTLTTWKSIFGRIEPRDRYPVRTRLGGGVVEVTVAEGSVVERGQQIALVADPKLNLQLHAIEAELSALQSRVANAEAELERGKNLLSRGVTTVQRLDALRTELQVIQGQVGATESERDVLLQRQSEGAVIVPISGTVLSVPVTKGSIVLPGEAIAEVGGGGFYLRLAIPERHAAALREGGEIKLIEAEGHRSGTLAKIYPEIENGRVIADVEIGDLPTDFIDARVPVQLPVDERQALVVPVAAVNTRMGLDFVAIEGPGGAPVERIVIVGQQHVIDGVEMIEVLSGLTDGMVLADHDD